MSDYPTKCTVCGEEKPLVRVRGAGMWCEGCIARREDITVDKKD